MPQHARIPTPLKQHLYRFRLSILPALAFSVCLLITLWLWNRQSFNGSVVGEVEAKVIDVTAGVEGQLATLPDGSYWQLFDRVRRGQPIAYLDDRLVQARMATVRAEAEHLSKELEAARSEFELTKFDLLQQHQQNMVRLQWEVESRRVDRLELIAAQRALKAQLDGVQAVLDLLESLSGQRISVVDEADVRERRSERDMLQAQFEANKAVYTELNSQYLRAEAELAKYPTVRLAEVETVLEPIRAEIRVQEGLLQEIQVELENLVIKAPIDGVISAIYRFPGQRVAAADWILQIARADSNYVISYVRAQQRIALYEGMEVGLRLRDQPGTPEYISAVETVGPQVTLVPPQQLANPTILEWATPVKIPIPRELQQMDLRPGQLIHVNFRSARRP